MRQYQSAVLECSHEFTLPISALFKTDSATSSGRLLHGEDMVEVVPVDMRQNVEMSKLF